MTTETMTPTPISPLSITSAEGAREFTVFAIKVMLLHTLTYMVFGLLARSVMHYDQVWQLPIMADLYRPMDSGWVLAGPILQPLRGLLYAAGLWVFRPYLHQIRYGWLAIWSVFVLFAILGTPAAAPGSMEGVIYTRLPMLVHVVGIPELYGQTLLFSVLLYTWDRGRYLGVETRGGRLLGDALKAMATALVGVFGLAIAGVVVSGLAGTTPEALSKLPGAMAVMGLCAAANLLLPVTLMRLLPMSGLRRAAVLLAVLYAVNAVIPAVFNLVTASPVSLPATLMLNLLPAAGVTGLALVSWQSTKDKKVPEVRKQEIRSQAERKAF
jgi:hypothetical protein